jgi:ATP-binding cassette subfamily C exporter for protease/lipase
MSSKNTSELKRTILRMSNYFYAALGFTAVMTFLSLAPIGYMQDVYGPVLNSGSTKTLALVTAVLILALIISAVLGWVRERILIAASVQLSNKLSRRTFEASFSGNLNRYQGARLALNDLRNLRQFITSPAMIALLEAPMGVVFLILVFLIHPVMGLLSTLGVIVVIAIALITERRVRPLMLETQRLSNASSNFMSDCARNALVIDAMGMRKAIQIRWLAVQTKLIQFQALASESQARSTAATKFVVFSKTSLVLGVGVLLSLMGLLPIQASAYLIIGKILGAKAVQPMMVLIQSWKTVISAQESYKRLEEFLEKFQKPVARMRLPIPEGNLTVESLSAKVPGTKTIVISNVKFSLNKGEVLAVLGASGAGKSSLARLILGIWAPSIGSVRLDGVEISGWPKSELGEHLGYLPQDVELFDGSLAENIARFGKIDYEKLKEVVDRVGLGPMIDKLPFGLNTDIGDEGCVLSGGQRQRVGLARAIYGNPKLVVLDEPNSSLDERGEKELNDAVRSLKEKGCTFVIITHRKSILNEVDKILYLSSGRVKSFGSKAEFLEKVESLKSLSISPLDTNLPAQRK